MAHDHDDQHASSGELDRAVTGMTKAIEIGFEGIHRRFDQVDSRMDRTDTHIGEIKRTLGGHQVELEGLKAWRAAQESQRQITVTETKTTVMPDDAKPLLTQGDVNRFTSFGRAIWPFLAAVGSAIATWAYAHWPKQP